jgi:hypothetical protein
MKRLKIIIFSILATLLSACSFGYDIVIVNDSNEPIEIRYKIGENRSFDDLFVKTVEDWNTQKTIKRFWVKEELWRKLAENEYETNLQTRERIIKLSAGQIIKIEHGNYNPISEEYGDLTGINELKINSPNGEIAFQGKLLLGQFEKDGYTFTKTYKGVLEETNLK